MDKADFLNEINKLKNQVYEYNKSQQEITEKFEIQRIYIELNRIGEMIKDWIQ